MLSLLLTVFLVQLACYLASTIGSKPINDLLWNIYSKTPLGSTGAIREQIQLRREVVRLKRELNGVSAQDNFAKWAKIRRQHDDVLKKHDEQAAKVSTSRASFDVKASALRWICTTGLRFGMQFWHAKTPIFEYPREWFPWYIEWALGFPRCPYGGVSINVWSAACGIVISLMGDLVIYALQYVQEIRSRQVKQKVTVDGKKVQ